MTKIKKFEKKEAEKAKTQEEISFTVVEASNALENPQAVLGEGEEFFKKNQKWFIVGFSALALSIGGYFGFKYFQTEQNNEAAGKLYPAEYFLQADSLGKVLKGEGKYWSAKKVADEYGISQTAKLGRLYTGIALMKENKFKEAVAQLEQFSSDDMLVQARAYSLLGDAYMELNKLDDAIKNYRKASNYYPNQFFTPVYLMKLALAYELKNDKKAAIGVYDEILKDYYNSAERNNAQKYKARLEAQ
ncbi:MAG: tetratricopeptide repeat protein [Thermonemataceae bacterium]|nr:tetratricopeptide repeat protein [Thermonemataceae bacterium]